MARQGGTSTEWKRLREQAFRIYGHSCVICGEVAREIDHIIELDQGGLDEIGNLQPLCTDCHKRKTAAYNSKRLTKNKKETTRRLLPLSLACRPSMSYIAKRTELTAQYNAGSTHHAINRR